MLASSWLQGVQGLLPSDCAKGGHGIPDTANCPPTESRAGLASCLEEIPEGFTEKVTSELGLAR